MTSISSLCVYCGSSSNVSDQYKNAAAELGRALAERGITLVYGGGKVGLMGICADACLHAGGRVIGIIPEFLRRYEVGHGAVTELVVVENMHDRKARMADLSDGFIVLPGGFGTLDEFFEILTWRQLALHDKPIVVANIGGYWDQLSGLLDGIIAAGFAKPDMARLWQTAESVPGIFDALAVAPPPRVSPATKWA